MSHFPKSRRWCAAALCVALFAVARFARSEAEDEEPTPKKPAKKIVVDDEPGTAGNPWALPDIARAAASATQPSLKAFFTPYTVAHDRLTLASGSAGRIAPLPLLFGKDQFPNPFGAFDMTEQGPAEAPRAVPLNSVRAIEPFEKLALADVEKLLNPPPKADVNTLAPMADRLTAAERLLTQVLFFHESAAEQNKRKGKNWEPLRTDLANKLTDVRLKGLELAAAEGKWDRVRDQVTRFGVRYRTQPEVLVKLHAVRLLEAEPLAKSDRVPDLDKARDLLSDFDSRFPNSGNPVAVRVRTALADKAKELLTKADLLAKSNPSEARNLLRTVEGLDPDNADLRKQQKELTAGYSSIAVGAWRLPERMSPATARYDSEKQAVELVFEGLTEPVPDAALGVRYRPVLIDGKPAVSPLARDLTLVGNAEWAGKTRGFFDAGDLDGTLKLLRAKREMPSAEAVRWLGDPESDPADPGRVRVKLTLGHPDPRQLLTVKMLPAKWFQANNKGIDDAGFAAEPFGTGPYKLQPVTRDPNAPPPDVLFVANPNYFRRPGRQAQPHIKEVRFVDLNRTFDDKPIDPVGELKAERLHVLPDLPTKDYDRCAALPNVTVATAAVNRRIHLMAINHRNPQLQSPDLRRGLMHAIDREAVLDAVYRAGKKDFHKPLTGPFPVGTWAVPRGPNNGPPTALDNRDLAAGLFKRMNGTVQLDLLYAGDDLQAKAACELIVKQVAEASENRVRLRATPTAKVRDLYRLTDGEQTFALAYLTHDYRDDWFPLGLATLLDPDAAGPGGRNLFGFGVTATKPAAADNALLAKLVDAARTRDFDGRLKPLAHDIHRQFASSVPFVPLWQIDRHVAVSRKVKIYFDGSPEEVDPKALDPVVLLQNLSRWRLE